MKVSAVVKLMYLMSTSLAVVDITVTRDEEYLCRYVKVIFAN